MKRYILLFLVSLTAFSGLDAQSLHRRAEIAYEDRNYHYAVDAYEKYYAKKGVITSAESIPLANSYYHLNDYANAKKYYDQTNESAMSAQEWLNYGELLRKQGLYDQAKLKYQKAKKSKIKNVPTGRINLGVKACEWAEENGGVDGSRKGTLSKSGLSTRGQSFGLQFYKDGLVYSSTDVDEPKNKNLDALGKPILNLVMDTAATISSAHDIMFLSKNLHCNSHVGSADFSADGKTIYYTKLEQKKKSNKLKIYSASLNQEIGDWVREAELPFCIDGYNFAHPALSLNGRTMYFSSDMKGTKGGMDIFKVVKKGKSWGKPINLGPIINTEATEIFPYVTPGGYLSFSSDGHPGLGGLDAFWVEMEKGSPVAINNAARPINSSYDDFAAVIDPNDTLCGYVSSNRFAEGSYDEIYEMVLTENYVAELRGTDKDVIDEGQGEDSVASLAVEELAQEEVSVTVGPAFVITGPIMLFGFDEVGVVNTFLVDALSFKLLKNARFTIIDNISKDKLLEGVSDDSAFVKLDLKSIDMLSGQAITIKSQVDYGDFSSYTLELVSDRMKAYDQKHPIMLTPIMAKRDKVKNTIVADEEVTGGAPFVFDHYNLTQEGERYLDSWVDFLVKNPTVMIKLMTHTDGRGDISYNFKLSQRRAFAAKRYLISKGVNHMQVIARGYGERYPLVDCKVCTEMEHDTNRRIEVEVINSKK